MKLLLPAILIFLSHAAFAEAPVCGFLQTIESSLSFRGVQIVRRDERFGLHMEEDLVLKKWIGISADAFVGVDKTGRVFSVIKLSDRTIARLLSGREVVTQIFLSDHGLFAVNRDGEVLRYSSELRNRSPVKKIVLSQLRNWGLSSCLFSSAVFAYAVWGLSLDPLDLQNGILFEAGFGNLSLGMIFAHRASLLFEQANENTNGFVATGLRWQHLRVQDFHPTDGDRFDYILESDGKQFSLAHATDSLPLLEPPLLEKNCQDELLPRGIPDIFERPQ